MGSVPTVGLRALRSKDMHLQGLEPPARRHGCSDVVLGIDAAVQLIADHCWLARSGDKGLPAEDQLARACPQQDRLALSEAGTVLKRHTATASCSFECWDGSSSQLQPCGSCCPARIQHRHAHNLRLLAVLSGALFFTTAF